MFERTLVDTSGWRATVPIAYLVETALVGALVLFPLIHTQALSLAELKTQWIIVPSAPPPPPRAPATPKSAAARTRQPKPQAALVIPTHIPATVGQFIDEPEPLEVPGVDCPECVLGSVPDGTKGGILTSPFWTAQASPPPPVAPLKPRKPIQIRVGGQVEAARAISRPMPDYPPLARMARVQGTVRLEAVISTDGRIQNLRVLAGHPLLVNAALEAVARWRYQPTLLNGEPVEVVTEIDVNFALAE
jgi:protein TonB